MSLTTLSLALLLITPASAAAEPPAAADAVVETAGALEVSDATRALSELEGIYGTCSLLLLEARKLGDPRVVLAVEHRHARLALLHRAVITERARVTAAAAAGDAHAESEAREAIDEALMTARRLLAEAAGTDVAALGARLERSMTERPLSRVDQLWFAEGALEEQAEMVKQVGYAVARGGEDAGLQERLTTQQQLLQALLRVSEDAALTLAMTEQPDRADHEYRKIAVALSKMREVVERANEPARDGATSTGDQYPPGGSSPTGHPACERLVKEYWTPDSATQASILSNQESGAQLTYWEADWWADWHDQDRYERCTRRRSKS